MRPDDRELDDEIRAHLAISVKERSADGEDPEAARLAALRELGYIPAIRESMRRVWYSRWFDAAVALWQDVRNAAGSLRRAKGGAGAAPREGVPGRGRRDAGDRHRRQRGDLQRRARRAAASAGESRGGSAAL